MMCDEIRLVAPDEEDGVGRDELAEGDCIAQKRQNVAEDGHASFFRRDAGGLGVHLVAALYLAERPGPPSVAARSAEVQDQILPPVDWKGLRPVSRNALLVGNALRRQI
jgi:hypothetical protein